MKIIISPSKKQHTDKLKKTKILNEVSHAKALSIFEQIKKLAKNDLGNRFAIKDTLLEETYRLYQDFDLNVKRAKAIDLYSGVVFEQINHHEYNHKQIEFLKDHLVILSAMYGTIKPFDYIWPYRLDFNVRLDGFNLYEFWEKEVDDFFENEDVIVNLASNEFSKMLKHQQDKVININFYEKKAGKLRVVSYNAKKARGLMVNQIILNQIKNPSKIKEIIVDDYLYDELSSKPSEYNFIKSK